jgi:hypothetical protein
MVQYVTNESFVASSCKYEYSRVSVVVFLCVCVDLFWNATNVVGSKEFRISDPMVVLAQKQALLSWHNYSRRRGARQNPILPLLYIHRNGTRYYRF